MAIPWLNGYDGPTTSVKHSYELTLGKMEQPRPTEGDIEIEYINSGCISWSGVEQNPAKKMWASPAEIRHLALRQGDLLISEGGDIGRAALYDGEPGIIYQKSLHRARSYHGSDIRYLKYLMMALHGSGWLDILCNKATMAHFTAEKLGALEIPALSVDEQRRIADFLNAETARIDLLIEARRTQVARLSELWDSRLAQAISEQADAHGWIPLRRIVTSVEQGWSPQCDDAIADPTEWAVLKTSAVSSGEFAPLEHKRLPKEIEADLSYQVCDGDILMTRGSGSPDHVGMAALAKTDGRRLLLSDLLYRVCLGSSMSPDFVTSALRSKPVRGRMALLFRGQSGQTIKLRAEDIRAIEIPNVPAHLQAQIAADFTVEREAINATRRGIESSVSLLSERRQALITAAVTGGITV